MNEDPSKIIHISEYFPLIRSDIERRRFQRYGVATTKNLPGSNYLGSEEYDLDLKEIKILPEGCEVWWKGHPHPMTAYVEAGKIIEMAKAKRMLPLLVRFVLGRGEFQSKNPFRTALAVIGLAVYWKYILEAMHWTMQDVFMPENRYNQPSRELYRVMAPWPKIRDIFCPPFEHDMAYRLRLLDIFGIIDMKLFNENPLKEIRRVIEVVMERETTKSADGEDGGGLYKFKPVLKAFTWYLFFNRKLLNNICQVVRNIDMAKVQATKADIYWQNAPTYNYDFRGVSFEDRKAEYLREKDEFTRAQKN